MAELERQASVSESPVSKHRTPTEPTCRSITSSALTSLLPVAAASGIVRANYNTPKISFYSPSGNLIQPEGSSSSEYSTSGTDLPGRTTLYYNNSQKTSARKTLSSTACLPPARPTLVPLTTLPTNTAPMPAHLKHHHNYRHRERSQMGSCYESFIEPAPSEQGCGGAIRSDSLTLRSRTRNSPHKANKSSSQHKSIRALVQDLKSDASFYKSRYIALAALSCSPSKNSRKTVGKRNTLHKRQVPASARPQHYSTRAATAEQKDRASNRDTKTEKSVLGPLAGHALRICFCQPYDGAGERTRPTATTCTRQHTGTHKKEKDHQIKEEDIARPVSRWPTQQQMGSHRSMVNRRMVR
jgi:hypothetical protein